MDSNWFDVSMCKRFKSLEVSIKTGWGWWQIARWDCKLLKDIKFMLNVLFITNL